jgi:predicted GIY-YIG superfamily endonuclease
LEYLVYQGKYTANQRFWAASHDRKPSAINARGQIKSASKDEKLPVLCTQTAPYTNSTFQDTSSKWQVNVRSNNELITG